MPCSIRSALPAVLLCWGASLDCGSFGGNARAAACASHCWPSNNVTAVEPTDNVKHNNGKIYFCLLSASSKAQQRPSMTCVCCCSWPAAACLPLPPALLWSPYNASALSAPSMDRKEEVEAGLLAREAESQGCSLACVWAEVL